MNTNALHILLSLLICCLPLLSKGQGEIKDAEFVIEKEKSLTLPVKQRLYTPVELDLSRKRSSISLEIEPPQINIPQFEPTISSDYVEKDVMDEYVSNHFLKLGIGTLLSPYLLYNYQSQTFNPYGATIKHDSYRNGPVRDENSGVSDTEIGVWGKFNMGNSSLRGDMSFNSSSFYYYGLSDSLFNSDNALYLRDRVRQNHFRFSAAYQGESMDEKYVFAVQPEWTYTAQVEDSPFNEDSFIGLKAQGGIHFTDKLSLFTNAGISYASYGAGRSFYTVNPRVILRNGGLLLRAGAHLYSEQIVNAGSTTYIAPDLYASYELAGNKIYGSLYGNMKRNTLAEISRKNLFLNDSLQLEATFNVIGAKAGFSGYIIQKLFYNVYVDYQNWKNYGFFVNSDLDPSRFDLVYDELQQVQFGGEIGANITDQTSLGLTLGINAYTPDSLDYAWHLPIAEAQIEATQRFFTNFTAKSAIYFASGIKSFSTENQEVTNISSILDLSFQLSYSINQQGSVFLAVENILNKNNARYLNYPVRPLMARFGITFQL